MRGIQAAFLLLFWIHQPVFAQNLRSPLQYVAYRIQEPIAVDGRAETSWSKAPWSAYFTDIEGEKNPKYQTRVKMLWDENYLYFYASLQEPHVWADITERDAVIFHNNDFEIFLDPDGDTHNYMEFEVNALNTVWDLLLTKPYRNRPLVVDGWNIAGLKTAVLVNGTLNDPSDTDQGWTIEVAMPWASINEFSKRKGLPVDECWRINFSRVNWNFELNSDGNYQRKQDANGNYLPEYNWVWSPQGVVNMHEPERWGYVFFSEDSMQSDQPLPLSADESLKWELYAAYRNIKQYAGQKMDDIQAIEMQGEHIPVHIDLHKTGWNLWVNSPFSGKTLLIKEDGEYIIQ